MARQTHTEAPVPTAFSRAYRHDLNGSKLPVGALQLDVDAVSLRFGGVRALDDVRLRVRQGDVHAVIGPNGAGKTSLLNCISGLYRPQAGRITLYAAGAAGRNGRPAARGSEQGERAEQAEQAGQRRELTRARPSRIARWGVARSFQNIELFRHMTVLENLMLGRHVHMRHRLLPSLLYLGPAREQEVAHRELVEEVVDLLQIQSVRNRTVESLSYGFQKRVELGRALCLQPAVLLLDEPMAGMNAEEKEDMARYILDVNELRGVTVVLIEHDMGVVMDISDQVTVLDFGRVIASGAPADVAGERAVIDAYLGEEH